MMSWTVRIFKVVAPYLVSAWAFTCDKSTKAAPYAEKVPLIGKYLAWILNLPPRLNLLNLLELILSLIKKRPNPEVDLSAKEKT